MGTGIQPALGARRPDERCQMKEPYVEGLVIHADLGSRAVNGTVFARMPAESPYE